MTTQLIDWTLYAVGVLTCYLILWKCWALYCPRNAKNWPFNGQSSSEIDIRVEKLEEGVTLLASIATTAPFIGLVGTVFHIIDALKALGANSADIGLVAGPIGTALVATLIGIACAIPASVAYNLYSRRIQLLENKAKRVLEEVPREG